MKTDFALACLIILLTSVAVAQEPVENAPQSAETQRGLNPQKQYAPYPTPDSGYVTDIADLLSPAEEEQIEHWLWHTEESSLVEIAVVTMGSIRDYPRTDNRSIEAFSRGLFDKYGVGNLPKNDGVLLLVVKNDRETRIELGGFYGRSRDSDASRIIQETIIPNFKRQEYGQGIVLGVKALMQEFAGVRTRSSTNWMQLSGLAIAFVMISLLAFSLFKNGKRGWGWVCVGLLVIVLLAIFRLMFTIVRSLPESDGLGSSDSWSAGGFGGGFGGGSSGGGGATGSW